MRIALLGDIHANLPALEAVLDHARLHRVTDLWCVGDLVGYGAFPDEVVRRLRQERMLGIIGNYDLRVLRVPEKREQWGARKTPQKWLAFRWAYEHLSAASLDYLRSLPEELRLELQARRFLLTHGSPASSTEHLVPDLPRERWNELAKVANADVVVCGHSHVPFTHTVHGVRFINTGSVGRPDDGDPRAAYAILSIGVKRLQLRHYRVAYDVEKAAAAIRDRGLPEEFAQMLLQGRSLDAVAQVSESPDKGNAKGHDRAAPPAPVAVGVGYDAERVGNDPTLQAVLKLAQACEYEAQHAHQVTRLALRLFDELRVIHGLGPTERSWLEYAALLHDIGLMEGMEGHHKASLRIILETPLLPLGKTERLIVGSVARYHSAALPREKHRHFARLKPAARRLVRILAGILRVADGLDYTHHSVVEDVVCDVSAKQVRVNCLLRTPPPTSDSSSAEAERERALEKGELLEQVLERKLAIDCRPGGTR